MIFECPHCMGTILVEPNDINCQIFRHAVFRSNGQPIHPHASKTECEDLLRTEKIYGCGRPFRLVRDKDQQWTPVVCDYI